MSARSRERALVLGGLLGLLAAGLHLLRPSPTPPPAEAGAWVARVDGHGIARSDFDRAIAAVAADRREGLRPGDAERVLERLIDEEILVQRALELGLAERDPRVRAELARAMLDLLRARAEDEAETPDESVLRAYYESNAAWFGRPAERRFEHVFFQSTGDAEAAMERATTARALLQSGAPAPGDPPPVPVGSGFRSIDELRDRLGETVARIGFEIEVGTWSSPIASADGVHLLRVREARPEETPPYEAVRDLVRADYLRRTGERALHSFLRERRGALRIDRFELSPP